MYTQMQTKMTDLVAPVPGKVKYIFGIKHFYLLSLFS